MRSMMGEMRDHWVLPMKYLWPLTYPTDPRRAPFLSRPRERTFRRWPINESLLSTAP